MRRGIAQIAKSGLAAALGGFTGRPARDHSGSIGIRVADVSARQTAQYRLVAPILPREVATTGTLAGGIARIDKNNRNSGQLRFVGDKRPELVERPTVENDSLLSPNRYAVTNVAQIFELDSAAAALGSSNDLLRNAMVQVAGKPGFLARKFLQPALGRPCSFPLQSRPQAPMAQADRLDVAARVPPSVRIGGDIGDSEARAVSGARKGL